MCSVESRFHLLKAPVSSRSPVTVVTNITHAQDTRFHLLQATSSLKSVEVRGNKHHNLLTIATPISRDDRYHLLCALAKDAAVPIAVASDITNVIDSRFHLLRMLTPNNTTEPLAVVTSTTNSDDGRFHLLQAPQVADPKEQRFHLLNTEGAHLSNDRYNLLHNHSDTSVEVSDAANSSDGSYHLLKLVGREPIVVNDITSSGEKWFHLLQKSIPSKNGEDMKDVEPITVTTPHFNSSNEGRYHLLSHANFDHAAKNHIASPIVETSNSANSMDDRYHVLKHPTGSLKQHSPPKNGKDVFYPISTTWSSYDSRYHLLNNLSQLELTNKQPIQRN